MAAEVVHYDDVSGPEHGNEELAHIGEEALAIDRSIEEARSRDAVAAQCSEEGQRLPVAVRHAGHVPLAFGAPASERGHVGFGPGLVDEDRSVDVRLQQVFAPPAALSRNIWPCLLIAINCFF